MKILTILGARPQFVKAAAVSREISLRTNIKEVIVHTGQHFDANMSDIFFKEMDIPMPNYNLNINSLSHGAMTGRMIEGIEKIIQKESPDVVMVYGDTNSTIAGALAAKKLQVKIAHVEAGLRSFNYEMPEEINRILTDRISDYLLCPTQEALQNLEKEGFEHFPSKVVQTGDVMMDAALYYSKVSAQKSAIIEAQKLSGSSFILTTIHRQENTDSLERLSNIVKALNKLSDSYTIVLPLHPRTKKKLEEHKLSFTFPTIDPVGYFDMVELLKHCTLVMTDSGGLQKEAFYFKKYGITLRDQTEWVELVDHQFSCLSGANYNRIINGVEEVQKRTADFSMNLYGTGNAAQLIIDTLSK